LNTLLAAIVVDWTPVVLALATAIAIMAPACAAYIQSRAIASAVKDNSGKLDDVAVKVNGKQDDLTNRVRALEQALLTGNVTVLHTDDRRSDGPAITEPTDTPTQQ
jgi:hypothetical protein